jgi:hypothetical protein
VRSSRMRRGSERCRRTPTPSRPISYGMSSYRGFLVSRWRIRRETCRLFGIVGIARAVPINHGTVRLIFVCRASLSHVMARCSTHRSKALALQPPNHLSLSSRFLIYFSECCLLTLPPSLHVHERTSEDNKIVPVIPRGIIVVQQPPSPLNGTRTLLCARIQPHRWHVFRHK